MRLTALGLVALTLAACPRKPPDPVPVGPADLVARLPTLTLALADLDLGLYGEFVAGPAGGTKVATLARRHDADRYTATLQSWGPPDAPVLQLEDTDSRNRTSGAVVGWKLIDGPQALAEPQPVGPQALLSGQVSTLTVGSVLQRAWEGGAVAADPFDLLLQLAVQLPAPWSVCRPRTPDDVAAEEADDADAAATLPARDPVLLYAVDDRRGARLALRALPVKGTEDPAPGQGPFQWTVDHLEQAPSARPVAQLWTSMGYADCPELGRVLDAERVRRPKRPLGPQD